MFSLYIGNLKQLPDKQEALINEKRKWIVDASN